MLHDFFCLVISSFEFWWWAIKIRDIILFRLFIFYRLTIRRWWKRASSLPPFDIIDGYLSRTWNKTKSNSSKLFLISLDWMGAPFGVLPCRDTFTWNTDAGPARIDCAKRSDVDASWMNNWPEPAESRHPRIVLKTNKQTRKKDLRDDIHRDFYIEILRSTWSRLLLVDLYRNRVFLFLLSARKKFVSCVY